MLRVLQRWVSRREGLDLHAIVAEIAESPGVEHWFFDGTFDCYEPFCDELLCTVESVCNELVLAGHVDQVWHGPWPTQRYRTASLLELLAMASR